LLTKFPEENMNFIKLNFWNLIVIITAIMYGKIIAQTEDSGFKCFENKIGRNSVLEQSLITPHNPFNILDYKL